MRSTKRTRSKPGLAPARSCRSSSATRSWFTTASCTLKVFVTEDMVGHRLGEFSPTRTFRGHGGRVKKEAESAAPAAAPAGKG